MSAIPDIPAGSTGDQARGILQSAGFSEITVRCETGNSGSAGSKPVVSVDPAVGTDAKRSSQVRVTVNCE